MSGVLGDFLVLVGVPDNGLPGRLADVRLWPPGRGESLPIVHERPAPGVAVWHRGDVRMAGNADAGGLGMALDPPSWPGADPDRARATLTQWADGRRWAPADLRGRFVYVCWQAAPRRVLACTDAFRTCPIYYAQTAGGIAIASDLRLLLRAGVVPPQVSPRAVYHYLNFSYVPAPASAIEGVAKLPPGQTLEWNDGQLVLRRYWDAVYPTDVDAPEAARAEALRDRMVDSVRRYAVPSPDGWGTFLSGGTDSSSIASILSQGRETPVRSFSIGFDEDGYDELGYSRIASETFGLIAHERRVGEAESVDLIPRLVGAYDEPFGNSSAIPTHFCAELAAQHGVSLLIAGDGGDEIFGGNERYRKDVIFERYHRLPGAVRALGSLAAWGLKPVDSRFANRVKNFIHRGSLPNPDRFYSDDSFASDHFETLLAGDFRRQVGRDDSLDVQREVFGAAQAHDDLHRLMYLDLKMTIADNDVVKVVRASRLAGVQVAFPYLDRDLIDYTGRLPASDKVRGLEKRHLFKLATQQILPEAIRKKKKQGFGLPVSVWMRRPGRMHQLIHDVVLSPNAVARGYFEPGYVRRLIDRHERGAWDHACEIYLLLMLELWHREVVDA